MAKIAYVKAWGLWSHYETQLDFSDLLTVVTGPNDSGKSAVIRIVRWVFTGEPTGEAFLFKITNKDTGEVIEQTDEGKAEVGLDNGVVITKTRRKGKTVYTHSGYTEPFETANVPQEIAAELGIKKYSFGDFETYLNFAFQLEAPFLLSETPSTGAKVLGKLAGTEAIDLAIADLAKSTHKAREEKRTAEKEIKDRTTDLIDFLDLDELIEKAQAADYLIKEIDALYTQQTKLTTLAENLHKTNTTVIALEDALGLFDNLQEAVSLMDLVDQAHSQTTKLYDLTATYYAATNDLTAINDDLLSLGGIQAAGDLIRESESEAQRLTLLVSLDSEYQLYTSRYTAANDFLKTAESIPRASELLNAAESAENRKEALAVLGGRYIDADYRLGAIERRLKEYDGLQKAAEIIKQLETLEDRRGSLQQLYENYKTRDMIAKTSNMAFKNALKEYDEATKEISDAWDAVGGICPLCDQPVDAEHRH